MGQKIALCLSGQMRTFRECYDSLVEHIITPLQPDIFIHTWSNAGCPTNPTRWKLSALGRYDPRLKYAHDNYSVVDEMVSVEYLQSLYNPKYVIVEDYIPEYAKSYKGITVPNVLIEKEPLATRSSIPMFYKIWACEQLRLEWEREHNITYDAVIRLRPDLRIDEKLPADIFEDLSCLHYAEYLVNHQVGISDKLAIGNSDVMNYYCSVWEHLERYWSNPLGDGEWGNHRVNERLLKQHMRDSMFDVKCFDLKCEFVRSEAKAIGEMGIMGLLKSLFTRKN